MTTNALKKAATVADVATLCLAVTVLAILVLGSLRDESGFDAVVAESATPRGRRFGTTSGPCDEVYVVGEGETLHTISDRCGDPFIVERNPHVHDSDDVFPGLVIKITPSTRNK